MSLIHSLTSHCDMMYCNYGPCIACSHPSGHCSGGCLQCSEEVNFHQAGKRADYNCQKFLYYYVCRYSWKYCSEIMYALDVIDLRKYPHFNILSLGCGGTPDLMAFEELNSESKPVLYHGYDVNPYWEPIQNQITAYARSTQKIDAVFNIKNIFDVLNSGELLNQQYNVVVLEYLLSHFPDLHRNQMAARLFDGLINQVILNRATNIPFLILVNDIDHYKVRNLFDVLLEKIKTTKCPGMAYKFHFSPRSKDYGDGSSQYDSCMNRFAIPEAMKSSYACAINCSSAQFIIELR